MILVLSYDLILQRSPQLVVRSVDIKSGYLHGYTDIRIPILGDG